MEVFPLLAVITLVGLAFGDLIVGVVNDAVNFLNSAIGSRAARRSVIIGAAACGILLGTVFSDGIIEVARKGIFDPSFFTGHEALIVFTAVALADIILLDLYSTFGLPTSTTVAVVFELLGAAFVLALWKTGGLESAWSVINGASAVRIVVGILLSIAISFMAGLLVQAATRAWFSFEYGRGIRRTGFLWCGASLSAVTYFILLKGAKHVTFMTPEIKSWIASHTVTVLLASFAVYSIVSLAAIRRGANMLRVIVLVGTMSLAMAFAGNDLANFIGVSVAGVQAFLGADLGASLPTPTWVLLAAGLVMALSVTLSRKARTVSETEVRLASHSKHAMRKWQPNGFSSRLSSLLGFLFSALVGLIPGRFRSRLASRWRRPEEPDDAPAFDLLRAAVNLTVAASVIAYATSQKLPLSTTYVTFMVAMGTALADRAWSRECAPCRIAGVMVVVGGWFVTALLAMAMAGITVTALHFGGTFGLGTMVAVLVAVVLRLWRVHERRTAESYAFA